MNTSGLLGVERSLVSANCIKYDCFLTKSGQKPPSLQVGEEWPFLFGWRGWFGGCFSSHTSYAYHMTNGLLCILVYCCTLQLSTMREHVLREEDQDDGQEDQHCREEATP